MRCGILMPDIEGWRGKYTLMAVNNHSAFDFYWKKITTPHKITCNKDYAKRHFSTRTSTSIKWVAQEGYTQGLGLLPSPRQELPTARTTGAFFAVQALVDTTTALAAGTAGSISGDSLQ